MGEKFVIQEKRGARVETTHITNIDQAGSRKLTKSENGRERDRERERERERVDGFDAFVAGVLLTAVCPVAIGFSRTQNRLWARTTSVT